MLAKANSDPFSEQTLCAICDSVFWDVQALLHIVYGSSNGVLTSHKLKQLLSIMFDTT